jgi:hypothetical protein
MKTLGFITQAIKSDHWRQQNRGGFVLDLLPRKGGSGILGSEAGGRSVGPGCNSTIIRPDDDPTQDYFSR